MALSLNGIKIKIWKERVITAHKPVRNHTAPTGKKKPSLRARLLKQHPHLKVHAAFLKGREEDKFILFF
jgi:hypothetical protein